MTKSIRAYFQGQVGIDPNAVLNELISREIVLLDEQGLVTCPDDNPWTNEESLPF